MVGSSSCQPNLTNTLDLREVTARWRLQLRPQTGTEPVARWTVLTDESPIPAPQAHGAVQGG